MLATHLSKLLPALSIAVTVTFAAGCQAAGGGDSSDAGPGPESAVPGISLMTKMAGLWAGPAAVTPLGPIPIMNMDFRAVNPHVLFGRVDLDAGNNLRFEFDLEAVGSAAGAPGKPEEPALVFRNGGYFLGILRDSRTRLVEYDPAGPSYHFCALQGGCDYIDARFGFTDERHLTLDVKVRGTQHVLWSPERKETRTLPAPFPTDASPQGSGDAPFPPIPRLMATVSWDKPLPMDSDVLVVMSATDCNYLMPANLGCTISRSLFGPATAGATSASLVFDQIHAGTYKATAILDRHGTLKQRLFPQSGDGISIPNQTVVVAASGESTASVPIVLPVP